MAKYQQEELIKTYENLKNAQTAAGVLLGSLLGAIAAGALYWMLAKFSVALMIFLALLTPGFIIGFCSRYTGKAYELKYRAIAGLTAFGLHIFACTFLASMHPTWLLLAFPNAIVASYFSKTQLTHMEKTALWWQHMGLNQLNKP